MTALILSAFPRLDQFERVIPLFTADGLLPPGEYLPVQADFETRFVHNGDIVGRNSIYDGWNAHRAALKNVGVSIAALQLLNGSFTTAKLSPGDIDIAVEVPIDNDALHRLKSSDPIPQLLSGPAAKFRYRCDAYPIYKLPPEDPLYDTITRRAIEYWTKWFGRNRQGLQKGRIWAKTGGFA